MKLYLTYSDNNNSYFRYEDSAGLLEEILNFSEGYGIGKDGKLIDSNGMVYVSGPPDAEAGKYGNGMFFMGERKEIFITGKYYDIFRGAFYNAEGQIELDLSQYSLVRKPYFKDNYCILEILNEAGVTFTTIIDKSGNFLFEPVKGRVMPPAGYEYTDFEVSEGVVIIKGDDIKMYDLEQNTISVLPDDMTGIGSFHDGWAAFDMGYQNVMGFMDKNGEHLKIKLPLDSEDV